jgi:alginate O-acetyltransferase complex protein AlgI
LVVFILSGFWHGANWTFLIWGFVHAFYFFIYLSLADVIKRYNGWFINIAGWLLTFSAVTIAWIFFRAENFDKAWLMLSKIVTPDKQFYVFVDLEFFKIFAIMLSVLMWMYVIIIEGITDPCLLWFNDRTKTDIIFCSFTLFLILSFRVFQQQTFIYFQF